MPGKVKVRVLAGRNLPVMDRANDTTDAFVEIRLGSVTQKTDVCRRSLNPQWNSDWFRFEVQDDAELQDEPLQIRVMDHDTYSAHDAIGKVYLSLSPLLAPELRAGADTAAGGASLISGWIPIYDTLHGIRGEINVMVKVDLFSDFNKFRHSSCGVQYFSSACVPAGHCLQSLLGFVHELVVNDDPEYQWIDKIRTPRASNEARQTLFSKLSGEVQRRIGVSVIEAGGNAVIGYRQCFDLEGETGIVVRGIGTAVCLSRSAEARDASPGPFSRRFTGARDGELSCSPHSHPPALLPPPLVPDAADADKLSRSIENDANLKATSSSASSGADAKLLSQLVTATAQQRGQQQDSFEAAEFPFITLRGLPAGFVTHLGGTVSARSVKLLDRISQPEESESRDSWWAEVRTEVRSHCKALACNVVLGYEEATTICDDVCVLSACGTAATVNFAALGLAEPVAGRTDSRDLRATVRLEPRSASQQQGLAALEEPELGGVGCAACHLPYGQSNLPLPALQVRCALCRKSRVPDVIFCTIEPPDDMPITGRGCLVQARVCREKADLKAEPLAKEISDRLPFLEYELHQQMLNKLRILGMNALFDLTIQVTIGEEMMVAIATATAVYLTALPPPVVPRVTSAVQDNAEQLAEAQRRIAETVARNRETYQLHLPPESVGNASDNEESDDEEDKPELDLSAGNKDACILEIDDAEDADMLFMLMSPRPPESFELVSTSGVPGLPARLLRDDRQLFTRVVRTRLANVTSRHLALTVEKLVQGLYFKLRKLAPCALCGLRFSVDLPEHDQIQVSVYGAALSVAEPAGKAAAPAAPQPTEEGDATATRASNACYPPSPLWRGDCDVIITPLPHVAGGRVERWLGNLNFFFIRECTGLREVGGLNGFMQDLVTEVLAVARAHVTALGGNALLSYFMSQCVLLFNPHKNQAQCLVNVGGDAAQVSQLGRCEP